MTRGRRRWPWLGVGTCRIDRETPTQRTATQQQRKQHVPAIGQVDVDVETLAGELHLAADEPALGAATTRVGHCTPVHGGHLAADVQRMAPTEMQAEAQPGDPAALEAFQGVDMQRTAARPGIELGLQHRDAQLRQGQPLPPAQGDQLRSDRIWCDQIWCARIHHDQIRHDDSGVARWGSQGMERVKGARP